MSVFAQFMVCNSSCHQPVHTVLCKCILGHFKFESPLSRAAGAIEELMGELSFLGQKNSLQSTPYVQRSMEFYAV